MNSRFSLSFSEPESPFLCVVRPLCVAKACLSKVTPSQIQPTSVFHQSPAKSTTTIQQDTKPKCLQQKTNAKLRAKPSTSCTKFPLCSYVSEIIAAATDASDKRSIVASSLLPAPQNTHTDCCKLPEHESGPPIAVILCLAHRKWCKSRRLGCEFFLFLNHSSSLFMLHFCFRLS